MQQERVVIQNGLVTVETFEVSAAAPLDAWMPKIERRVSINSPTLPVGARAFVWDTEDLNDQTMSVLIEQQPNIANLDHIGVHRVSLPFVRFLFVAHTSDPTRNSAWSLEDYRVFFSNRPYSEPDIADMIPATVPNVYDDGRICFGSTAADANQPLHRRLAQLANEFWVSRFNNDLSLRFPNGWNGWGEWEDMTENDPTGWAEWSDWDNAYIPHYSWNSETNPDAEHITRFDPMVSADGIPEVPLGATWGRASEWYASLGERERNIVRAVATA